MSIYMKDGLALTRPLVSYVRLTTAQLPPQHAQLYEYIFARNGIFVRAERPELAACIPISSDAVRPPIVLPPGDYDLQPFVHFRLPPVIAPLVAQMVEMAQDVRDTAGNPQEIFFGLHWLGWGWGLIVPEQDAGAAFVRPTNPYDPAVSQAIIEVHSHHRMAACFSTTDDRDETGFKLYGVLGDLDQQPTLRLRVGIYGHHHDIPASSVLSLPHFVHDAVDRAWIDGGQTEANDAE